MMEQMEMPAALEGLSEGQLVDVDVRDDLRAGNEPFRKIMEARQALEPGQVMRVRAIFEPTPLYRVMASQGLDHWTERLADDDWRVWFFEVGSGSPADEAVRADADRANRPSAESPDAIQADNVVVLDVRGLEPPEPMVRTLEALEELPRGGTLVQINARVPQFLLPRLEERGFTYDIREQDPDLVRVFITHRSESDAS